jgi:kynureninase
LTDLLDYRAQFDSLTNCHYLISNSLGAMPNRTRQDASRFVDLWQDRGVRAWEDEWWMLPMKVGNRIGQLIGAPENSVTMFPNVTSAESVILSSLDFDAPRDKVVMANMEFPSLLYLHRSFLRDRGGVQVIDCPDEIGVPIDTFLDAIDERTRLVSISHVLFRSAYIVDIARIVEKAHAAGALVAVDLYQSAGIIPIDVTKWQVDFAVGGCLKWLCGGPSACFLYVRPDLAETLRPRITGWAAHEEPFVFDNSETRLTSGAYRFQSGTPVVPPLYTCQAGLDMILEIGADRIRQNSLKLTDYLMEKATRRGWPVRTPKEHVFRGGTVSIDIPDAEHIMHTLVTRDFLVDYRPKAGIRVSPHFYNTLEEIDDLIAEIEQIQAEGVKTS